ncbi:hypothetical protein CTI12_AA544230 [Artemisia annua]|uniref:TF-B3 domain-containing protein n=1 Tax=Artemisia annua TaxID=35608 RepID=A0A2U1L0G4_ARTAN|nr:hypothetical protein CTI12_AA544230 [Artemisia annua]
MLVIQKQLSASDLAGYQNRLTMPYSQLQTLDFLTPDECTHLDTRCYHEIDVPLLGPTLKLYEQPMTKLVRWMVNSTETFVLRTGWNNFVLENKNDLKIGSKIQVWSFRKNQQLCFAIAVVERAD